MKKILYLILSYSPLPYLVRFVVGWHRPRFLIRWVIRKYFVEKLKVDISEAELPLEEYPTILDFFTRRLRPGVRSLSADSRQVLSPVDGTVMNYGRITQGLMVQVKNSQYSLKDLVGSDLVTGFDGGDYITLYLSPRDYHRIHHPVGGWVSKVVAYPGKLLPVNRFSLENFIEVFSRNRRVVVAYNTGHKVRFRKKPSFRPVGIPCLSCWVGALNVGQMRVLFDETFYQSARKGSIDSRERLVKDYPSLSIKRGEEAGCFELGSTVILIFPPHAIRWLPTVSNNTFFRLGEPLARIHSKAV